MAKQLITMADYARQAGVSRACVTQWVKRGVIGLEYGRVDPIQADAARQKWIAPRVRPVGLTATPDMSWLDRMPRCAGCGMRYGVDCGSADPTSFCSDECMADYFAGLSQSQIAAPREAEAPDA